MTQFLIGKHSPLAPAPYRALSDRVRLRVYALVMLPITALGFLWIHEGREAVAYTYQGYTPGVLMPTPVARQLTETNRCLAHHDAVDAALRARRLRQGTKAIAVGIGSWCVLWGVSRALVR